MPGATYSGGSSSNVAGGMPYAEYGPPPSMRGAAPEMSLELQQQTSSSKGLGVQQQPVGAAEGDAGGASLPDQAPRL